MPTLDSLTEANLGQFISAKSLKKGYSYLIAIRNPQRVGNSLSAHVADNRMYQVEIVVDDHGLHARCTCPYNWDGGCKHTGAVLLKWVRSPGDFAQSAAKPAPAATADYPIDAEPVEPPVTYRPDQPPFWLTSSVADRQQAEEKQLAGWLETQKLQDLRALAKKRDWSVKGTKKADIAQQLIGPLTDSAEIIRVVFGLDAEHAQVFRAMVLMGNEGNLLPSDIERVARHWGRLAKYVKISTYTGHLCEQGLAVSVAANTYPARPDYVPRVIVRNCPPPLEPVLPGSATVSTDIPDATLQLADPLSFLRKVQQLILMLEQTPTPLRPPLPRPKMEKFYPALQRWDYDPHELAGIDTKKIMGYTDLTVAVPPPQPALPDAALLQLAPVAGGQAELEFMLALLTAAGVFQPGSPVTVWPELKEQFFRQGELAQRATLARTWFIMTNWSELWAVIRREPGLQMRRSLGYGGTTPDRLSQHLTLYRRQVLRLLASLPDNRWLKVDDLAALLQAVWPRFDNTRWEESPYYYGAKQKPAWYLARPGSIEPLSPDSAADWQLAQWGFVIRLITGPLHWLGLVDLYEDDGQPLEIRLHGLADLFWDRAEAPAAPHPTLSEPVATAAEAVAIAGDSITINPAAVSARVHGLLDHLARLDEVLPDRFVYTLSVQAVHAAFEAGRSLTDLLAEWAELMPHPIPDHLRARLETWWRGYGQVRIYDNITAIEFGDDYALAEMKAVTSLAQLIIAEISPRLVLIPAAAVDSLTVELEKAGYTPQQTDKV